MEQHRFFPGAYGATSQPGPNVRPLHRKQLVKRLECLGLQPDRYANSDEWADLDRLLNEAQQRAGGEQ